jgi:hypothetical protein
MLKQEKQARKRYETIAIKERNNSALNSAVSMVIYFLEHQTSIFPSILGKS